VSTKRKSGQGGAGSCSGNKKGTILGQVLTSD
jgi:hypothetical protein